MRRAASVPKALLPQSRETFRLSLLNGIVTEQNAWSVTEFTVIYKGISRWRREGRQEAVWLHFDNSEAAEAARDALMQSHYVQDVYVLGSVVVVNQGAEALEREVDAFKTEKHFDAKLRTALREWKNAGGEGPLTLAFLTQGEAIAAKAALRMYVGRASSQVVVEGSMLVVPQSLAKGMR